MFKWNVKKTLVSTEKSIYPSPSPLLFEKNPEIISLKEILSRFCQKMAHSPIIPASFSRNTRNLRMAFFEKRSIMNSGKEYDLRMVMKFGIKFDTRG
jgi:hypothetical protein